MKTAKLLLTGLIVTAVGAVMCYGDDTSTSDLLSQLNAITTSTTSSTNSADTIGGSTNFLSVVSNYMDKNLVRAFYAAYEADQLSDSPSTPEGFFLDYCTQHEDFRVAYAAAIQKAKDALGIKSDEDLNETLKTQVEDLKKQIEDSDKLKEDEKEKYQDMLDKYAKQVDQLNQQLANSQSSAVQALQAIASMKAQQKDPMAEMMPMMMMMMMMMIMGGGQGG